MSNAAETATGQDVIATEATTVAIDPMAEQPKSASASLWRNRNFTLFWAGQTFDALGDSFAMIVMPLLVLEATGSIAQMGLVTGTMGVASLIAGIISGIIVDRLNRRWMLILCDLSRAFFYALLPLGWLLLGPKIWLIYVVGGCASFLTTTFMIAYTTAIPSVVDQEHLVSANGRLQGTVALAYIVGPMMGGIASHNLGPELTICILLMCYLVSAVFMFYVRLRKAREPQERKQLDSRSAVLDELLAGVRFLLRNPVLRSVTLLFGCFIFLAEAIVDLSIYRLKHDLGQNDGSVGLVFGIASLGAIVGGAIVSLVRHRVGFGVSLFGSMLIQGIAIAAIGLAPSAALIATLATVFTFGNTMMRVNTLSVRQQITPDHLLGRVTSAFLIVYTVPGAMGAALGTAVAQYTGAPIVLTCIGILALVVATAGFFTPANQRRPEEQAVISSAGA